MKPVVVLGAGIAGSCVALALRRGGAAVVVVDASSSAGGRTGSATVAAGGMLAAQYEAPAFGPLRTLFALARERHAGFAQELERLSGVRIGRTGGGMLVANRDAAETAAAEETARCQRSAGLSAEVLDCARARTLQDGLAPEADSWLWLPDEGRLDAQRLPQALRGALAASGTELRTGAAAVGLETRRSRVRAVRLADGSSLPAENVVVALGAWSGQLGGLPAPLPIRPVRGQIVHVEVRAAPRRGPLVADHSGRYVVPREDGSALLGSTMEEAGFEPVSADRASDQRSLLESAGWLWPDCIGGKVVSHWAGLRPVSADGLPVLGPDPTLKGLYYAAGYGRSGILLAPIAGDMVANRVLVEIGKHQTAGSTPSPDWRPFGVDRLKVTSTSRESTSDTSGRMRPQTETSRPRPLPETLRTEPVSSSSG